jgi:hypothetical protein
LVVMVIEHVVEVTDYRGRKKHFIVGTIAKPDDPGGLAEPKTLMPARDLANRMARSVGARFA